MAINWANMKGARSRAVFFDALDKEMKAQDYYDLSDILTIERGLSVPAREWLAKDEQRRVNQMQGRTWKIRVLCDEWGRVPPDVEDVVIKRLRPLRDPSGRKVMGREINEAKRRGTYEQKFVDVTTYKIDEYGCINATLADAMFLLEEFGVHHASGEPICGRREISSGPQKCPYGGERHVRYWRYQEVPPSEFGNLQPLKKTDDEDAPAAPKRGRKPKAEATAEEN